MADWSQPQLTTGYAAFLSGLTARDTDALTQMQGATGTNLPDKALRWNPATYQWETYSASGGTWAPWTVKLTVKTLLLGQDPVAALEAATKQYVDAAVNALVPVPAPSTARELNFIRINAGGTAYETQTAAQVLADIGGQPAGNYQAAGSYAAADGNAGQQFVASGFLAAEGTGFGGTVGYSFSGDGGYDTGMFSSGDGYIQFYTNTALSFTVNPGGVCAFNTIPTTPTPGTSDNSANIPNTNWVRTFVGGASVSYANSAGSANTANSATNATNANYANSAGTANNIPNGAGAVGTYAFALRTGATATNFGDTVAGSSLEQANVFTSNSTTLPGTWRCMGWLSYQNNTESMTTLWVRIS